MESYKLVIHIRYFEFEDGAFVACGQSRTRDVPLLFSGNKDRKHTCIRWELGVHPIVETRRNVQDGYVHAGVFGLGAGPRAANQDYGQVARTRTGVCQIDSRQG